MATANNIQFAALNPLNAFKTLPAGSFAGKALPPVRQASASSSPSGRGSGFEMAPNYGEESKKPKRTVPRAMYISVIGLGIFYTVTSWAAISGYHTTNEAAYISQNQAFEFFFIPAKEFGNEFLKDALSWLIITGSFACGMAFHNTTARYMYSLGREKVLPNALGKTHPKHRSPYIASITQSVIAALIILLFVWRASVDSSTGAAYSVAYIQVYGFMAVMGVVSILAIQALVSVAIFNYFRKHHQEEHTLVDDHYGADHRGDQPGGSALPGDQQAELPRRESGMASGCAGPIWRSSSAVCCMPSI